MSSDWKKETLGVGEWMGRMEAARHPMAEKLYAMYSSVTDGITIDPAMMFVPVDDHMVHRGDGLFESFKCVDGNIYNLDAHLERLEKACGTMEIDLPVTLDELAGITVQTIRAGGRRDALVRLLVSRGTGTMGVNPYECSCAEIYIVVYKLTKCDVGEMPAGVRVITSAVPLKPGFFATVKTCNYLPNVLMKKEAVDAGVDFVVSIDENGNLGEGATENVGIVTPERELLMPPAERVLAGTTAKRALQLAQSLVANGLLKCAEFRAIPIETARAAAEMHIYGTTPNVTPVTEFDGAPVGDGQPGPVAAALFEMLKNDMTPDSRRLTNVFDE
ncbi:MAG: aminotransferase class IV [Kiritimatiellales bacterium]|nr:aminotransferase class IV [Kiritimatiellales bacterium]